MSKVQGRSLFWISLVSLLWPSGLRAAPLLNSSASASATSDGAATGVITPAIAGIPKMFLPDIGIAADTVFERNNLRKSDPRYSAGDQQPRIRDGQVVFFSPIDPFTNAQFTVDLPEHGNAEIEEAWIYFDKVPLASAVRVGRFLPQFGLLDLLNTFQLPMLDRPSALGNYLGSDGLNGTGLEMDFFVPNPWGLNLKANLNAVRGDTFDMGLGSTVNSLDLTYLSTLDYSQDFLTTGTLQAGVSVAQGPSPYGRSETLEEPYLQIQWAPTQRRVWTWSAEGLLAQRRGLGAENNKYGFYTFLDYNFALRYHLGFLVDLSDRAVAPYGKQLGLAPNATWALSDNTRLRLQYQHNTALGPQRPEEVVSLQATFSLGNLKQLE
jgi:hypothetical protein